MEPSASTSPQSPAMQPTEPIQPVAPPAIAPNDLLPNESQPSMPPDPSKQVIVPSSPLMTPETSALPDQTTRPVGVVGSVLPAEEMILPKVPVASVNFLEDTPKTKRFKGPRGKKPLIAGLAVLLILVGGSAAAYFGYYVPNKPENLWGTSLVRMGKGYDKLTSYVKDYKSAKGSKVSGSFQIKGDTAADGSIEGSNYGNDGEYKVSVSAEGIKVDADLITLKSSTNQPDLYFKLNGLDGLGPLLDAYSPELGQAVGSLNGQWYFVDHSLFDQIAGSASNNMTFSRTDVSEVLTAAAGPTKKYVFTDDTSKMAFVIKKIVGKEKQDDRTVQHYQIGFNKANLKAYDSEMCTNLSKTKLFKWLESTAENGGVSFKDCKDTSSIDSYDASSTADVYVDTHTKLIHKVRFIDKTNANNYFDVLQDYQGGDSIPFGIAYNYKQSGNTVKANLNATLNMSDNSITVKGDLTTEGATKETGNLSLKYTPSDAPVNVQKPANSKNIMELLNDLGIGDIYSGVQTQAKDTKRKTDINALQGQIEAYYANNGVYPTLANINNSNWRATNMKGLDPIALQDPDGSAQTLSSKPAAHVYSYVATPSGCNNVNVDCTNYTLTATLDAGGTYVKQSIN